MQGKYVVVSGIFTLILVLFFLLFEKRKLKAKEVSIIAVLCAISVASRAAFIALPSFKPMLGLIFIWGMALGANTGFLTGALSAFISNFIFGQGPWTPWQMVAFGIMGLTGAVLKQTGMIKEDRPVFCAIAGSVLIVLVIGPLLDIYSLFSMINETNKTTITAVLLAGLPINLVHALAVFFTILLLEKPLSQSLERIKIKYGIF